MYRPFLIFSIVTSILTACLLLGLPRYFEIEIFRYDGFLTFIGIYFLFSFVSMTILFLRDSKIILAKPYKFRNILLYILTTPATLLLFLFIPTTLRDIGKNITHFRPVTNFKICKNCIADGTPVKVIYRSGGPTYNDHVDFYYHYLVVNQANGDTLNVLTTFYSGAIASDNLRTFTSKISDFTKVIQNLDQINDTLKSTNISDLKLKEITKVVINPNLADENNRYKTVIGELGLLKIK